MTKSKPTNTLVSHKRVNRWRNASLRRARQVVATLADRVVDCDDWHFDTARGARFIECVRRLDWSDGDTEEQREILAWVKDHGQSLDWIFCGDPSVMICNAAAAAFRAGSPNPSARRRRLHVIEGGKLSG
jgi:hypothetical protein